MSITETLDPVVSEPVTITLAWSDKTSEDYTQQPLSFFGKMELFAVLGGAVEKALSTDSGFSLASMLNIVDRGTDELTQRDLFDADTFVRAIATLLQFAPDLLLDIYCISLRIPRGERAYVKTLMEDQITDDEGIKLLDNFVEQNWDVMTSFFYEQIVPLTKKLQTKVQGSAPSKPSKRTRRDTQKQS